MVYTLKTPLVVSVVGSFADFGVFRNTFYFFPKTLFFLVFQNS